MILVNTVIDMVFVNVLHAFSSVLWTIFFKHYLPDYKEWWSESLYTFWGMFAFVAQEL
jgi:hypothetical protein